MRKLLTLTLLLCLLSPTTSFAQSGSAAAAKNPAPTKNQAIVTLLAENDAAKQRVADLEQRERELADEVRRADDATKAWRDAHDKALIELGETRAEIKSLRAEIAVNERHIEELRAQRDEARGERDAARTEAAGLKRENRFLKLLTTVRAIADIVSILH